METSRVDIAIIGGGASGALVAAHLVRGASPPLHILVFERAGKVGEGIAYGTSSTCHLLNVPARSMSAFEDDPEHFVRWLATKGQPGAEESFAPRALYGRYLRDTLWAQGQFRAPSPTVETVYAGVVDLEVGPHGPELVLDNGHTVATRAVVLATGVVMRQFPASLAGGTRDPRCIADPWVPGALAGVAPPDTVTLLGSGLTAVDVLLALREDGHRGPVHAFSRHGLLPRAHRDPPEHHEELEPLCRDMGGDRVRPLLHAARQIVEGGAAGGADWRDLVDALRPDVPRLWAGLSPDERLRFRRHLERFWSINRHRMAPQIARTVEELLDSGTFFVHAGAVESVSNAQGALQLQVKLPVRARSYAWSTDWLVNCTGTDPHLFRRGGPLMDALMARGTAHPGPIDMGVATDDRGRSLDARGRPWNWLWAIGSLRQGQLLESTAVPEIRAQAAEIARDIEGVLSERDGTTNSSGTATTGPPRRPLGAAGGQLLAS